MLKKLSILLIVVFMVLVGCSGNKEVAQQEKPESQPPVQEEEPIEEVEEELPYQFPLTGVKTAAEPMERPVAVVINNHPAARPNSGLHQADLVYEVLAEGDVTRFLAIFASEKPENIGPVRSARDYFLELAKGYNGFFIAHGYSPSAKQMLDSGYIDHINGIQYDGTLFKRVNFRKAPHNSYITYENILKGAENHRVQMNEPPASLAFLDDSETENLVGQSVQSLNVSYGSQTFDAEYVYDEQVKKYRRYSAGVETADLDSEESVLLDNVMVVEMDHRVLDNEGRRAIDLVSGGRGYLLQQGVLNEIEWRNIEGRILPYVNGNLVGFVPGKTWISIVPSLERVSF